MEYVLRKLVAAENGGRLEVRGGAKVEGVVWSKDTATGAGEQD